MMKSLKPYPEYRHGPEPSIGEVPAAWRVAPLAQLGWFYKGRGGTKQDEVESGVSCLRYGDLYTQHEFSISRTRSRLRADRAEDYTRVALGDVLFAASGETLDDIGRSAVNLVGEELRCGGDIIAFRATVPMVPKFLGYACDAPTSKEQKARMGHGFTVVHIYASELKRLFIPVPPIDEQAAIVSFLDHVDRKIKRYIRAKKKLIALLNEQKQAIIHRSVTRGLDPNVKLKPSGLKWLGDVPVYWELRPANYHYREVDVRSEDGSEELLSVSHLTGVTPRSQKNISMFMAESYVGQKLCRPNDLVINTMWAWMGAMGVSRHTGIVSSSYGVYRPKKHSELQPGYADILLRTWPYVANYLIVSTGIRSSRLRLYPDKFLKIPILCPPAEEQLRIVEQVGRETAHLTAAVQRESQHIDLFREYRSRLIADVVTGKLDVREVAAKLPELSDEDVEELAAPESEDLVDATEDGNIEEAAE